MSIQDLGALGEFVAAIAVIVSLVYLAIQVRRAGKMAKASVLQSLQSDVLRLVTGDPEIIAFRQLIVEKQQKGEQLTPTEQEFINQRTMRALRIHENQWYQYKMGLLDEELYRGYQGHWRLTPYGNEKIIDRMRPGGRTRHFFHPNFADDFLKLIDSEGIIHPPTAEDT